MASCLPHRRFFLSFPFSRLSFFSLQNFHSTGGTTSRGRLVQHVLSIRPNPKARASWRHQRQCQPRRASVAIRVLSPIKGEADITFRSSGHCSAGHAIRHRSRAARSRDGPSRGLTALSWIRILLQRHVSSQSPNILVLPPSVASVLQLISLSSVVITYVQFGILHAALVTRRRCTIHRCLCLLCPHWSDVAVLEDVRWKVSARQVSTVARPSKVGNSLSDVLDANGKEVGVVLAP